MFRDFSFEAMSAGLFAAFIGATSAFVVLEGIRGVGASEAEAVSCLMALSVAMGLCAIIVSVATRQPISVAWSTPGAAFLATTGVPDGGFPVAVGAFLISSALIVLAGFWRPLGRWVAAIPGPLASAMLAGVLFGLCLAPFQAIAAYPATGLAIFAAWAVTARFKRMLAMPAAILVAAVMVAATTDKAWGVAGTLWSTPVFVMPEFTVSAAVGIALPLFVITMASQNITGIAVLNANGYRPSPGKLFSLTGVFGVLAAPFGGHAVNLAAITAALCSGPEAHADPARRYWSAIVAGVAYVLFGLAAGAVMAFVAISPPVVIQAVAGLALLGAFASSLMAAVKDEENREAAVIAFLVTASGLSFAGIGGAFWGLLTGGVVMVLKRRIS